MRNFKPGYEFLYYGNNMTRKVRKMKVLKFGVYRAYI